MKTFPLLVPCVIVHSCMSFVRVLSGHKVQVTHRISAEHAGRNLRFPDMKENLEHRNANIHALGRYIKCLWLYEAAKDESGGRVCHLWLWLRKCLCYLLSFSQSQQSKAWSSWNRQSDITVRLFCLGVATRCTNLPPPNALLGDRGLNRSTRHRRTK